jgi:hypothetical protein
MEIPIFDCSLIKGKTDLCTKESNPVCCKLSVAIIFCDFPYPERRQKKVVGSILSYYNYNLTNIT